MAIKEGHKFHKEHGFTGSAHKSKEHRPSIPGHERGEEHMPTAKEHFGKKSHVGHEGPSMGKVSYDEHGFEMHKKGGMCG